MTASKTAQEWAYEIDGEEPDGALSFDSAVKVIDNAMAAARDLRVAQRQRMGGSGQRLDRKSRPRPGGKRMSIDYRHFADCIRRGDDPETLLRYVGAQE